MKRLYLSLFLVVLLLAMASCVPAAAPAGGGTIKIGLQAPLTGDYAEEGKGFQNAVQLLVDQTNAAGGINGQKVQLIVEDDKGDPKEAALVADRLISQKVMAVIGGYNSGATEPASTIYNNAGILHVTPSSTATRLTTKGYQQFFRVCFLDDRQGLFAADFMTKDMGYKNIAILHDNSTFAQGLAEETKGYLEKLGVTPVFYDAINPKDTDFSPTLTKIKAVNPDAIYFTGYYAQGGLLAEAGRGAGPEVRVAGRQRHEQHGVDPDRRPRQCQGHDHHD